MGMIRIAITIAIKTAVGFTWSLVSASRATLEGVRAAGLRPTRYVSLVSWR